MALANVKIKNCSRRQIWGLLFNLLRAWWRDDFLGAVFDRLLLEKVFYCLWFTRKCFLRLPTFSSSDSCQRRLTLLLCHPLLKSDDKQFLVLCIISAPKKSDNSWKMAPVPYENPDLKKERQNCPFNKEEITNIVDGGVEKTKERRDLGNFSL